MSRVKVYLSNTTWEEPSTFINDGEYISLTNAARMINTYPVTIENGFVNNGMSHLLVERPYTNTGKGRVSTFITLESFQWYLISVQEWYEQVAEEAIAEVRSKAAAAIKKKQKKDDDEEEEYVEEEEVPPLPPVRAARPKRTTTTTDSAPPPWWKNLEGEIYPMTNPATFTGVLNSDQLKKRCNIDIEKQVRRKLASDFDAEKEAADMLPIIQKRLRESSAIRDRVQSEVASRCAWEKIRPFEISQK
jgi:hypothetical protein